MTSCHQAPSHYLNWPRSLMTYGITRPQWVNWVFFVFVFCVILTHWTPRCGNNKCKIQNCFMDWHREHFRWNFPHLNTTEPHQWWSILTQISLGHNELKSCLNHAFVITVLQALWHVWSDQVTTATGKNKGTCGTTCSSLVQIMAWCQEAPSHYLNQWWPTLLIYLMEHTLMGYNHLSFFFFKINFTMSLWFTHFIYQNQFQNVFYNHNLTIFIYQNQFQNVS